MAFSSDIRAGAAFVELYCKDNRFVRGMRLAEGRLKAFGAGVMKIGALLMAGGAMIVAPILKALGSFAAFGDQLNKMSARTGISAESLSELKFAAEQSGSSLEDLEKGVRKMQRTIVDASEGEATYVDVLDRLGLAAEQLMGKLPADQFKIIADRIAQIEDPSIQAATAMELFGRSGALLLPLMKAGAAGINELMEEARELGLTMSTEDAQAAADYTDAMNRLKKSMLAAWQTIGASVAPALTKLTGRVTEIVVKVKKWIDENRGLILSALKIGAAVMAAGAAVTILGALIWGLGGVLGAVATIVTTFGTVIGVAGSVLGFLVSPIGLVVAAVVGLGAALVYYSGAGGKALDWLRGVFNTLKEDALLAFGGIADALKAGDIALAGKILWSLLKLEFQRGANALKGIWIEVKESFWASWTEAVAGICNIWTNGVAILSKAWAEFSNFVVDKWKTVEKPIARFFARIIAEQQGLKVEDVLATLEEDFARAQRGRAEGLEGRLERIEADRLAGLAGIEEDREKAHVERGEKYAAEIAAGEKALADAKKELADLREEAARKAAAAAEARAPGGPEGPPGLGDLAMATAGGRGPTGTFSARAATLMGLGGSALDRTAKATEETAKNTAKTEKRLRMFGINWGP